MPLTPGQRHGNYVVESRLGQGGMAEVWAARHQLLGSRHALKVLHHASHAMHERLLAEGRAQAQLDHPGILAVRDVLDVEGRPVLVMPLVTGGSLRALIDRVRLTPDEALALFRPLVEAMAFAHERGFIHRDLKPANVLLDAPTGRIRTRIADFGLVKQLASTQTNPGIVLGTPAYAAPEQLRDASIVDERADLFSLGVMLVELLTGQLPYGPTSNLVQLRAAHHKPPLLDGVPEPWTRLTARLLAVNPDHRPQSCRELLAHFESVSSAPLTHPRLVSALQQRPGPQASAAAADRSGLDVPTLPSGSWKVAAHDHDGGATERSSEPHHNLTSPRTTFVGRGDEMGALASLLAEGHRLITILGGGGLGKTRLSRELALDQISSNAAAWPDGVWFVPLDDARTEADIIAAVARVLGIPPGKDQRQQLRWALRGHLRTLIVLDNFEQIVGFAERTLGCWLDETSGPHFLVTSREPLRLSGERTFALGVLDTPEAIELFVERARHADRHFTATGERAGDIVALVELLDRLPLAIELAAARSRLLSPGQLLTRMSRRFDVLKTRSTDRPLRQRTLWTALAWSWDLLNPTEQSVLSQCSWFEGGFTLDAADAVVEAPGDGVWVEDVLSELVDKSLLSVATAPGQRDGRLTMLLSVQQFARDHTAAAVDDPDALIRRHAGWFSRPSAARDLGHDPAHTLANIIAGADRLFALHAPTPNDRSLAVECAVHSASLYLKIGPLKAGAQRLEGLAESPGLTDSQRARILTEAGMLSAVGAELDTARATLTRALHLARRDGDERVLASCLCNSGRVAQLVGDLDEAVDQLTRSLSLARRLGATATEIRCLGHLGTVHLHQGDLDNARVNFQLAVERAREAGDTTAEGTALGNLGVLLKRQGDLAGAMEHYQRAIESAIAAGYLRAESIWLGNLANLRVEMGETTGVLDDYQRALRIATQLDDRRAQSRYYGNIGNLMYRQGRTEEAEWYYRRALQLVRRLGDRKWESGWRANLTMVQLDVGQTDVAVESSELGLETSRAVGDPMFESAHLINLGRARLRQGQLDDAERLLCQATAVASRRGLPWLEGHGRTVLASVHGQRGALDDAREQFEQGLPLLRTTGDRQEVAIALCRRAIVEGRIGDVAVGSAALEEARALRQALGPHVRVGLRRFLREAERAVAEAGWAGNPQAPGD